MKKVSKLLFVILISFLSLQSYGQTFGLRGGLNLSNMLYADEDGTYSDDFKMKPGFHVGGIIDFSFTDLLSLETGLIFDTKGFTIKEEDSGESIKVNLNTYYLDIPIVLKASVDVSESVGIYGVAGPYIGMGLSGNTKSVYEYQGDKETDEESIEWGNDAENDDLKRLDYGLTFGGGIKFNALQIGVLYDLGLANISAYTDYGAKINNRVLRVTASYWFGK